MRSVPNLFRTFDDPHEVERYYSVYLVQLLRANRIRRVIEACGCIRRFAKNHGRPRAGLFTFQWEITRLAGATAAPLVPILLTIVSPEELIMRILRVVF
jgi:hypothetical protein